MSSPADSAHPVAPPQEPTIERIALESGPAHTRADWEKAAAAVLRKSRKLGDDDGDDRVWDRLTRTTLDGIGVTPLGTPDDLATLVTAGRPQRAGEWDVRAHHADPDAATTRSALLTDLENGVTSLWIQVGEHGIPVSELRAVLADVLLDVAPVVLDAPGDQLSAAQALASLANGTTLADGTNLGFDPVGASIRRGGLDAAVTGLDSSTVAAAGALAAQLGCRALVVDATAVHDLGASDAQELGYAIAVGAAYLRQLVDDGRDVAEAADLLEFRLAATDEQFPTIAKLRAARRLWTRVLELSGVDDAAPMRLHAVTSRPMMSKYDPWVNMLRTCVAAFAAGVGGADAVTVLPFDAPLGLPDAFSRRIARNTSALLISESHVARVTDPAGGAYAVEKLTDDVAAAAWGELGRLESATSGDGSGSLAGLPGLAARIDAVVAERDLQIARRKRPITGLSEFPNLAEVLPERAPYAGDGFAVRRYGHAFEALRDEPAQTPVFLATMGTVAAHTARATFASNLFAAGGIAVVNPGRADDVAAVVAAYSGPDGGQPVVCLTGSDAAYAAWGADLVAALRQAGARWVILAGKAPEGVEVDDTCAMGLDALDFLRRTREQLA
ncbi:methylmalonyl-CoA mutase family protein [Nocardioides pocheonensis]|uniref:Methylmalonyl-CoA mutase n=1 Tax=Nocardioides pocheonensis TaxID=661485 RepID=A0A3N0GM29_9ACTN|nr:methylmalonyl-CoA mutase family protein [Nocardioides pocheonensis]RNM13513.1 methylmalonyl-CoA mutase [Nocardioides pocheonensis]